VRDKYEWNRIFNSSNQTNPIQTIQPLREAPLHKLFMLTGGNGNLEGALTLPTSWVIDWTRFYDFMDVKGTAQSNFNRAKKIGTSLSLGLAHLPGFPAYSQVNSPSVAILDLQMGSRLEMLTGQEVANEMEINPLSPAVIAKGPHSAILKQYGFDQNTPLWYYVLKEAEITAQGKRLGEVGSRIVGETIVELIEASEFSILKDDNWYPDLGQTRGKFEMRDLLLFVNDLNPLGYGAGAQASARRAGSRPRPTNPRPNSIKK